MQIRYTRHARQRMAQRQIAEREAWGALETPDEIVPGKQDELTAIRRLQSYEVRVIFSVLDMTGILVHTVIRVRHLKREDHAHPLRSPG
jgi:hypothetical protein